MLLNVYSVNMGARANIPPTAGVVVPSGDGRLSAPAAEKNADPITDLVKEFAPDKGTHVQIAIVKLLRWDQKHRARHQ